MLMYHRVQNMGVDFDSKNYSAAQERRSMNNTTVSSGSMPMHRKRAGHKQRAAINISMNSSARVPMKNRDHPYSGG
jgi:hypothetical protein